MPTYQNGKIYKIVNDLNDKVYVGSTTQTLSCRMSNHRSTARNGSGTSHFYSEMRRLGAEHFKIVLIKNFPCNSKDELESEEFAFIVSMKTVLNGYNSRDGGDQSETNTVEAIAECKKIREQYLIDTSRRFTFYWDAQGRMVKRVNK